jgi:hypothetical protein
MIFYHFALFSFSTVSWIKCLRSSVAMYMLPNTSQCCIMPIKVFLCCLVLPCTKNKTVAICYFLISLVYGIAQLVNVHAADYKKINYTKTYPWFFTLQIEFIPLFIHGLHSNNSGPIPVAAVFSKKIHFVPQTTSLVFKTFLGLHADLILIFT